MDETLRAVFQDLFGTAPGELSDQLSMQDVEAWDSVHHFTLVLALEEAFGVMFSPDDIPEMTSVGKIKSVLSRRTTG
jgi:acyl carrier protein